MPSFCTMFLAPICIKKVWAERVKFWEDVHGVRMSCLAPMAITDFFGKPSHDRVIDKNGILADPAVIYNLDMNNDNEIHLEQNTSKFHFSFNKAEEMHGFGAWFDTAFDEGELGSQWKVKQKQGMDAKTFASAPPKCVVLSTSPSVAPTHWKQVQFIFREPIVVSVGEELKGTITFSRNKVWRRHFDVVIEFPEDALLSVQKKPANFDAFVSKKFHYTLWRR